MIIFIGIYTGQLSIYGLNLLVLGVFTIYSKTIISFPSGWHLIVFLFVLFMAMLFLFVILMKKKSVHVSNVLMMAELWGILALVFAVVKIGYFLWLFVFLVLAYWGVGAFLMLFKKHKDCR